MKFLINKSILTLIGIMLSYNFISAMGITQKLGLITQGFDERIKNIDFSQFEGIVNSNIKDKLFYIDHYLALAEHNKNDLYEKTKNLMEAQESFKELRKLMSKIEESRDHGVYKNFLHLKEAFILYKKDLAREVKSALAQASLIMQRLKAIDISEDI